MFKNSLPEILVTWFMLGSFGAVGW